MKVAAVLILALLLVPTSSWAKIYKWVDEKGKTHYGESIPERYQKKGEQISVTGEPTQAERAEAARIAAQTRRLANRLSEDRSSRDTASSEPLTVPPLGEPPIARPLSEQERYEESVACFDSYRNVNGSVKPEAYSVCEEVKRPSR